jgi:hypothetical protein
MSTTGKQVGSWHHMWGKKAELFNSMKWHRVNEDSIEEREITVGWGKYQRKEMATFGTLDCSSSGWNISLQLKLRKKINIFQANVCAYCRNRVLKELNIEAKLEA